MPMGPLFNVGGHKVDRHEVNPELIRTMAESARKIHVEGNASPQAWTKLADRVAENDEISPEDLKQIQGLGRACYKHHLQLHSDYKASSYSDRKIKAEMENVHVFEAGADQIKKCLELSQTRVAVQALAGASFGPIGLVTAFAAHSNLQKRALEPLMEEIQGFRDGTSPSLYQGNKTKGVHGDEIWKEMNDMLDSATKMANAGKPTEVDAQYYELTNQQIIGKLAKAAEAGNKVRVNVDPGRLVAFAGTHVVIDEVPDKLRALLQLSEVKGDVGVSFYAVNKELGGPNDLMHRKGLRVGEKFLLSGMNANEGSGENVDAGYVIEGPAARRLVQNFARDVDDSAGASKKDVFGEKPLADFMDGDINMGARGLVSLFDCADGPSPAGTELPKPTTRQELEAVARQHGEKLSDYTDLTAQGLDQYLAAGTPIPLSTKGKKKFLALMERSLSCTRTSKNMRALADINLPKGKTAGTSAVALADLPVEREALMLTAIQEAEKFIYIPAFVMTRGVASMLVAKRDEMKAQGKDIDIRVMVDPGIYPDGGTPNELGVKFLEDAGIPVRWANLPRSGDHDRKVHAKNIRTDKGEFVGSTNFSNKGLRENWEHSGYVKFNPDDPQSVQDQQQAVSNFLDMWDHETIEINSKEKGLKMKEANREDKDFEVQADEARYGVVRAVIKGIENVEKASAELIEDLAKDPEISARIDELVAQGYDGGSAVLMAVREGLGDEAFFSALDGLDERQKLERLK